MRRIILSLTAFILAGLNLSAQSDTTSALRDSIRTVTVIPENQRSIEWMQTTSAVGNSPVGHEEINTLLTGSGYTFHKGGFSLGDMLYNSIQQMVAHKHWQVQLGIDYMMSRWISGGYSAQNRGGPASAGLSYLGVSFGVGYSVLKNSFLNLAPSVNVGMRRTLLSIEEGYLGGSTVEEMLKDNAANTKYRSVDFSVLHFYGEIGLKTDVVLYTFFEDNPEKMPFAIALSGGTMYMDNFNDGYWANSLSGPALNLSGLRWEIGLTVRPIMKRYKAKIISEE